MTLQDLLPFLIPLAILQLALMAIGLYDLTRPERRVKGDSKWVWGIVIVVVNLFGPLIYFLFGREEV
jgi:4-amino-4-deoxy-L-arabinose transferase-like glycosyltransferase